MRSVLTWVKYVTEKTDIDKKLFSAIRREFLDDTPKNFKSSFDSFIAENLLEYY